MQWTKLLLALGIQTLTVVYWFSATVTRLETELGWIKNRQQENFVEHTHLDARIDGLSESFQEHCVRQERERVDLLNGPRKE